MQAGIREAMCVPMQGRFGLLDSPALTQPLILRDVELVPCTTRDDVEMDVEDALARLGPDVGHNAISALDPGIGGNGRDGLEQLLLLLFRVVGELLVLLEELLHPFRVFRDVRIELAVGSLEIGVGSETRATVARPGDVENV